MCVYYNVKVVWLHWIDTRTTVRDTFAIRFFWTLSVTSIKTYLRPLFYYTRQIIANNIKQRTKICIELVWKSFNVNEKNFYNDEYKNKHVNIYEKRPPILFIFKSNDYTPDYFGYTHLSIFSTFLAFF